MINKRILTLITLLLFLLLLVGCDWITQNQPPVITTTTLPVATVGTAYSATIVATDADEEDVLTYTVSGPTDIVISSEGLLGGWTPAIAGTVAITVAVSDGKDSVNADFTIMVIEPEPEPEIELTGIEVDPKTMSLFVGETDFFKVTANYSDETTKNVTYDCVYVSNDTNIAKVLLVSPNDYQKSVRAVGGGTAKITVTYEGQKDTIVVTVKAVEPEPEIELTGIEVDPKTMSLFVGETDFFKVTANYSDETTKNVTYDCVYVSNDPTIAKVSLLGPSNFQKSVKAVREGIAKITVTYEGKKDTIVVKVNPILLASIEVLPETMDLFVGQEEPITSVTAHYNNGNKAKIDFDKCNFTFITLSNIDADIVTVDTDTGLVTAVAKGPVHIVVSYTEDNITVEDGIAVTVTFPEYTYLQLCTVGDGIAELSIDHVNSGIYSVKLYVKNGVTDWAEVSIPVDIPLKDISTLSFWKMVVAGTGTTSCGWNPGIMLAIDADGNGSFDGGINLAESLGGDAYMAGEFTKGLTEYDSDFVLIDACNDMAWWGADSTGWSPYYGSLSGFQAEYWGEIDPDDHVKLIKIVIGSTGSWMDETVYVDDITINDETYDLEP